MSFNKYPLGGLKCCIASNRYGTYCVPQSSAHRPAAQAILKENVWEPHTIELVCAKCADGDIIHAGTYFGDFLPAFSRALRGGRRVWAFEPNPENHLCADVTMRINNLANVVLTNAALGEDSGKLSMAVSDGSGRALGGASRVVKTEDIRSKISIDVVSLDEAVPPDRNISVIQLDVEGFELQALKGAIGTIRRCKPHLILETLPSDGWIAENLYGLGYALSGHVHVNAVLSPQKP